MGRDSPKLGRSTNHVKSTVFGEVSIGGPILALACGESHCLARSATKVRYIKYMVATIKTTETIRL